MADEQIEQHDGGRRSDVTESLHRLDRNLAILTTKFEGFREETNSQLTKMDKRLEDSVKEFSARYVTRDEHETLKKTVSDMRSGISWAVKIVVGGVIMAVLGLVLAKSGYRPSPGLVFMMMRTPLS